MSETEIKNVRQDFHNDVLLSNSCILMGNLIKHLDLGFYIQFHGKGQTANLNIKRAENILDLYKAYKILLENLSINNFDKIFDSSYWRHDVFIKRFTSYYLDGTPYELEGKNIYNETIRVLDELFNFKK